MSTRNPDELADSDYWQRLLTLDAEQQSLFKHYEQLRRELDAHVDGRDPAALRRAWQSYREAVAGLERVTAELERFRLAPGEAGA